MFHLRFFQIEQKFFARLFNFLKDNFNLMILWVQTHKELGCHKKNWILYLRFFN